MREPATTLSAQLPCPHCRASITYYDVQGSTHYGCPECYTFFKYEGEGPAQELRRFRDVPRVAPALPLGLVGTLPDGLLYRVVGHLLRKEASSAARWLEYVLFNPTAGYAQLAVYEGHWIFIRPDKLSYHVNPGSAGSYAFVEAEGATYNLYNKYSPRTLYAVGEFDYNILDDDKLSVSEFIAPPLMLVQEKTKGQPTAWYRAEHIEPAAVAAAFGVEQNKLPYRNGTGAIQPAPGGAAWAVLRPLTLWLLLLVVLTQAALLVLRPERQVLSQNFSSGIGSTPNPNMVVQNNALVLVSESFPIEGPTAVEVELRAEVDNSWIELPVSMVNEQTGQSYEFTKSIEYYHGYEGGENWSEGSVEGDAVLGPVPSGRYHLNVYPTSENNRPVSFTLRVTQNATLTSNVLLVLAALLIWPGILAWRRHAHEESRWSQSDYDPKQND
ncbi:DUF4178 domain-containing protein [Hymenobacter persicinus]|uniref:DUF4178 domain-containing protein n=1 Tax=Hymenobacter persicinus TaxID=2025506 RepID=A0A4Q5LBN8_9BACT|nr:DUF4178 domain-containing protein [Hymenobacter persicinus]RYU79430.1 DUF4178 domain-containing protein [Hymenobacter persicinus]